MNLSVLSLVFRIIIIAIIWVIIFLLLRIMYKDIKGGNKNKVIKKNFGLEVLDVGENSILRKGSVIPISGEIMMGRSDENQLVLDDRYTSHKHARIYIRNNQCVIEDLGSTNGTFLNGERINTKVVLKSGDEVKVGTTVLKVIG